MATFTAVIITPPTPVTFKNKWRVVTPPTTGG